MRKIILTALVGVMYAGSASAAPNNVGCGWGSALFEGKKGMFSQILASTTNGPTQTFGITSGTAGCKADAVIQYSNAAGTFMNENMDKVAMDMSVGGGEAVETLAATIGIKAEDKAHFLSVAKNSFDKIFTSENVTAEEVMASLGKVMAADDKLAKYTNIPA